MLDFMRRHAGGWVVRVALGIVTLVFIFFMGGGGRLTGNQSAALATVGDETISAGEYEQTLRRTERTYRERFGDQLNDAALEALDLPSATLNQLVDAAVLRSEAQRLGLRVPDEAVRERVVSMDAFQRDGQFSPALYRAAVQNTGMSAAGFESAMRRDMLAEQLVNVVRRGVHVGDDEAFHDWARDADKIVLSYVSVPASKFEDEVKVEDEALTRWFDEHAETYRQPDAVRVRYLAYSPKAFANQASVTDEAIEEYYVLNEDEFKTEETISARHILKKAEADADESAKAAARDAITKVKARLDAGEDFAAVAQAESEDEGSAKNGGDLGTFSRGRMVQPFEDAAFALQPGQTSDVVESPFGFHIIHVYDYEPAGVRPLAEVRDEIARKLTDKAAAERAFDMAAADAAQLSEKQAEFDKIAGDRGLEIKTTEMISKGDTVPEVGPNPAFVEAATALTQQGETSEPVHIGDTYYVLQLQERRESRLAELSEVRERAERDYRKEQARNLAESKASELVKSLEGGKTLEDVAASEGAEVNATEPFGRQSGFIPGLGAVRGLAEVAFQTDKDGDVLPRPFVHENQAYVFVRKSFVAADRAEFDKDKDAIIAGARQQEEQAAINEFVRNLKERMRVSYNQALLERYIKQ